MKVLIDIDRALADGQITPDEHARLMRLAKGQTSDLALNTLIGSGVIVFTVGIAALLGSALSLAILGAVLGAGGAGLILSGHRRWRLLGELFLVVGAAMLGAGVIQYDSLSPRSIYLTTAILVGAAVLANNGLLAALSVITLSAALGASTEYSHARYTLIIDRPTETVAVFTVLSIGLLVACRGPLAQFERIGIIAARTAALLVNFAFLVGSLWGDSGGDWRIPPLAFTLAWAAALLAGALWAWQANRRWPLILATVFGAIHFYTQLFERLGPNAIGIVLAGLLAIGIGFGLKQALAAMPPRTA